MCINEPCHLYKWVMSHVHMCISRHEYKWVMSRIQTSHVTNTNESCHIYTWVMSYLAQVDVQSRHTSKWAISPVQMSHVTCTNESCHIYTWVMSYLCTNGCAVTAHIWMSHVTQYYSTILKYCVARLIHMCDPTAFPRVFDMWRDSFVLVTFVYVIWLICVRDVTRLYTWRDSCEYVTGLIRTVWHDSFMTWIICIHDTTHMYTSPSIMQHVTRLDI